MANLVPIFVDKDTGQLVATTQPGAGGGGGGGGGGVGTGWLHLQTIASAVWIINHNQSTDLLLCQVYTTGGDIIIPDEITIVNINTVEIVLGAAQTGRAHIIFFVPA